MLNRRARKRLRLLLSDPDEFVRSDASDALYSGDETSPAVWRRCLADESSLVRMDAARAYWDARVPVSSGTLLAALASEEDEGVRCWLWVAVALRYPHRLPSIPAMDGVESWQETDGIALALLAVGRPEAGDWLAEILDAGYAPEIEILSRDVREVARRVPPSERDRVLAEFRAAVGEGT